MGTLAVDGASVVAALIPLRSGSSHAPRGPRLASRLVLCLGVQNKNWVLANSNKSSSHPLE